MLFGPRFKNDCVDIAVGLTGRYQMGDVGQISWRIFGKLY